MKKSELKQIIKEEIIYIFEDRSKKNRFLGIFGPGKDIFQRKIKNVDASSIEELIKYTESNGDEVERYGKSSWAITKESGEGGQTVWSYDGKNLMFVNPNFPSVYDNYIRTIV
jgi:hypothetical protein